MGHVLAKKSEPLMAAKRELGKILGRGIRDIGIAHAEFRARGELTREVVALFNSVDEDMATARLRCGSEAPPHEVAEERPYSSGYFRRKR